MQPLHLSEEQKEMLLEMAKKLFPEYENFGFENDCSDEGIMEFGKVIGYWKFIHWFEFIFRFLAPKIMSATEEYYEGVISDLDDFRGLWNYWGHPVDYLYKHFKTQNEKKQKEN